MAISSFGGKKYSAATEIPASALTGPGVIIKKLTVSTAFPAPGAPRALWVGTAGTFTGTDAAGNTITAFPLFTGRNDIVVQTWTGGTATDVWGLY